MTRTAESLTKQARRLSSQGEGSLTTQIRTSISRLSDWLEKNDYSGYDVFDGLNAKVLRPLTFETAFLRTVLQQGVRRFPINTRPLLGVSKSQSTKAMGFLVEEDFSCKVL